VTVIHKGVIYAANAGDSRAVVCQEGKAVALSFDHKPTRDTSDYADAKETGGKPVGGSTLGELLRIKNGGGHVTEQGRVNGNLNLSRALGDLKYIRIPAVNSLSKIPAVDP